MTDRSQTLRHAPLKTTLLAHLCFSICDGSAPVSLSFPLAVTGLVYSSVRAGSAASVGHVGHFLFHLFNPLTYLLPR